MIRHCRKFVSLAVVFGSALIPLNTGNAQSAALQISSIELSPGITIVNDKGVFKREWNPAKITPEYNSFRIAAVDADHPLDLEPQRPAATLSHDTVSRGDVLALVRSLTAPAIKSPALPNLGITQAWLEEHADDVAKHFYGLGDKNQQQFIRRSFTDLALIRRIMPNVIGATWTDDNPSVNVTVRFKNGRILTAETTSQPAFMLPWNCTAGGKTTRTYNADISRAVAKLLPEGTVNRQRLEGGGLVEQIKFQLPGSIKQRWQEIGAEDKAGEALARLRQRYTIRRSEVSGNNGLHFSPMPGEETLQADVRLNSFPPNLTVATVFPFVNGEAIGMDTFLQEGHQYEDVVLNNPWIMASLKKHAELGAWLIFVKDTSMSDTAMQIFLAEMHAEGRDDLGQQVAAHRNEVANLSYFGSELVLFPDHHAIIWRWDPKKNLFEWPASAIKTDLCADYAAYYESCTATLLDTDGLLVK